MWFLSRLWSKKEPAQTIAPSCAPVIAVPHPSDDMIPPGLRAYLENYNIRNLRYPPYQEGYPGQITGEWLMHRFQEKLVSRIMGSIGLPEAELQLYVEPIFRSFAEFVHLLPASECHHHSGPGGLLRHSLEVANLTLDGCLTTAFDTMETPARRSYRLRRWYVAGVIAALLHDAGKPITDIQACNFNGNLEWNPERETLFDWSIHHQIERYFLRWNPNRHEKHIQMSVSMVRRLVPPEVLAWILESGHDIYEAMLEAISGTGDSPLTQLVRWADSASVKNDLIKGPQDSKGGDTGVPITRLVCDTMLRLIDTGQWTINTLGSRVWVATDGVYIPWKAGSEDIVNLLVSDGINAIPRSPETLMAIMADHALAERQADGELYWTIAPHVLRKHKDKPGLKLRCLKLSSPHLLFPNTPVPAPTSITLGGDENAVELLVPNEKISPLLNAEPQKSEPILLSNTEVVTETPIIEPEPEPEPEPDAIKPTIAAENISLEISSLPEVIEPIGNVSEQKNAPEISSAFKSEPIIPEFNMPDEQTEEPQTTKLNWTDDSVLEQVLLSMAPPVPIMDIEEDVVGNVVDPELLKNNSLEDQDSKESSQKLGSKKKSTNKNKLETEGKKSTSNTNESPPKKLLLAELLKQPLTSTEGKPVQKKSTQLEALLNQPAPNVPSTPRVNRIQDEFNKTNIEQLKEPSQPPKPSVTKKTKSLLSAQQLELLTQEEQELFDRSPGFGRKLLALLEHQQDLCLINGRVFIPLGFGNRPFTKSDLSNLFSIDWLWQDFTLDSPGFSRVFYRKDGFLLTSELSLILCKVAGLNWRIHHVSSIPEDKYESYKEYVELVLKQARLEPIGMGPALAINQTQINAIAVQFNTTPQEVEDAIFCLCNSIKITLRKKLYIKTLAEELSHE